jgi:pyruvate kinase
MNRTKIICTIGPAVSTLEKMLALIEAGMNVARLNFSHGTHAEHLVNIKNLKKAREMAKKPLAIMLDTKGPEIRVGEIKGGSLSLQPGDQITLVRESKQQLEVTIHPIEALEGVALGMKILFDDGYILSEVVEKKGENIKVRIQNAGILKSNKGVNIPGAHIPLPAMTPQDIADLKFGCAQDIDYIAASFIRSAHHVLSIKELLAKEGKSDILVIAKIENSQGVENFDSIIQVADGIMIARGDLGVEVDLAQVPKLQKMMIRKCSLACKPAVTATQMLESMISNPRPTRAEVSDVANAIYDSTSAIMLSGETAIGKYPIETVKRMSEIVKVAEADFNYRAFFEEHSKRDYHDISSSVAMAAVKTGYSANGKAIFAFTSSGATARLVSRLRPEMPIIALTNREKNYHQLAFNWGVIPVFSEDCKNAKEAFAAVNSYALSHKIIEFGDVVIVTAGVPFGKKGSTNMMMVENIGEILVRGHKGFGSKVSGKISIILSPESCHPDQLQGRLVVLPYCDHSFFPLLKKAAGVILQNYLGDTNSEKYAELVAKTFGIAVITRADGAMAVLREEEEVTLDPKRGIVYLGCEESPSCKILSM